MNTTKLRSKRVILPTIAAVAAFGIGGVVWSTTANADLQGSERDRVGTAATTAVGGGTVVDAEASDDRGEAYEVEVRTPDGRSVDLSLDKDLQVVGQDPDDRDDSLDDRDRGDYSDTDDRSGSVDRDDRNEAPDADDRALSAGDRASAEKAALGAVKGTVVTVEASDDRGGEAYEVEVRTARNTEWNIELDKQFQVLRKTLDN